MASTLFAGQEDIGAADHPGRLYRLIADAIPHMVWTAGADGASDYFNLRFHQYSGLDSGRLAGWGWTELLHPEDRGQCLAAWARALQSGERYEVECRLRRADGVYRWHHGVAMPQRGPEGRVVRWFGTCTDIEDQVRSARALEALVEERTRALGRTERRLQAIIGNQPECVKLLDERGNLIEMNAAGLAMIEADHAQAVVGQCIYPLIAAEHRAAFRDLTERVCRGEHGTLEFELVGLKGTRRWMETHAVPFVEEEGGRRRLLAITRDISARKRAEEALRESEQRFKLFMENVPAYAWIIDSQSRYTYVNRAYARSYGCEPHQMLGQDSARFFAPELVERFREVDRQVKRGGVPVQYLDDALKGTKWLKIKFPFTSPTGDLGIGGIALDVTDRVQLQQRLMVAQELERRRLADNLHDLIGQNLTALGIELGALKARMSAETRAAVAPRLDAMSGLLNDTVESIRGVMTELRPPALEEYGLAPAVRWYAAVFSERTGMKVSMNVSADTDSRRLPRDTELALFRILQEALTNAAKHSGGTMVQLALTEYAGGIRLSVEDDGRGFTDPAGARSERRGGWGLPTMRERAEAHGGKLRIEFPGRGTRLVVEMPRGHD